MFCPYSNECACASLCVYNPRLIVSLAQSEYSDVIHVLQMYACQCECVTVRLTLNPSVEQMELTNQY